MIFFFNLQTFICQMTLIIFAQSAEPLRVPIPISSPPLPNIKGEQTLVNVVALISMVIASFRNL